MRHNNEPAIPRQLLLLLPALFACLLLGLFFTPFPTYPIENDGGPASGLGPDELLLRGRQAQRSATTRDKLSRETHTLSHQNSQLAGYFAEAHAKGFLSATALKEVEVLLQRGTITALDPYADVVEDNYHRGIKRREDAFDALHRNFSAMRPFSPWGPPLGTYIWDWFSPDHICTSMERVGKIGDGGKWICGLGTLRRRKEAKGRPCVIYSFGVNEETTFEEEMSNRTHCQIFAFDPTVPDIPPSTRNVSGPVPIFFKQALGPTDGPTRRWLMSRSLFSIMKELGHDYIDVLKVDVEGAEWETFSALFKGGALPVGQLLIELHYQDMPTTFNFFENMEKMGFRVFSRETNYHPSVTGKLPICIEYSFINTNTFWSGEPDIRSKQLLAAQPAYKRQNGVIYVLTRRERVKSHMPLMLASFDKHFNNAPGRGYPVIIFHDDLREEDEEYLRTVTTSPLKFHRVDFKIPAHLDKAKIPERTHCSNHSSTVGYRHMCMFLGLQVQDLLADYEYHWRLDDDSLLLGPIGYDPFRLMKENNKVYGFNRVMHDNPDCVVDLWNVTKRFVEERNLSPGFLDNWDDGVVFYNNFEISHRSLWQDPVVKDYFNYIDQLGGIYYVRWGDAPLRSLAVAIAVPEDRLHFFSDIGYSHLPWHTNKPRALPAPIVSALWHLDEAGQFIRDLVEDEKLWLTQGLHLRRQHGVIVIVSNGERYEYLKRCMISLEKHFNGKAGYHIWIWTHGLTYKQRLEIRALSSAPVRLDNMPYPLSFEPATVPPCGPRDEISNRLLAWEIPEIISKRYEWQWRLADDAYFTADLEEDPFRTMVYSKATYGMAALRSMPPGQAGRGCVKRLVDGMTTRLNLEKDEAGRVLDLVETMYFDSGFDVSHKTLWQDERFQKFVQMMESPEYRSMIGQVDEALLRSLIVALVIEGGDASYHIFSNLDALELPAGAGLEKSADDSSVGEKEVVEVKTSIEGHRIKLFRDSSYLGQLFLPQRLGFLDADLGVPVVLPTPPVLGANGSVVSGGAASLSPSSDMLWTLANARIGRMNLSKPLPEYQIRDAVALLSPQNQAIDFYWRSVGYERRPNAIINDKTMGRDIGLLPTAGLVVQGEGAKHHNMRLVLLCKSYNISEYFEEDQDLQVGSAIVVISNPREVPSRWIYDVRRIPGTSQWSGWHTALSLSNGHVSTSPETDLVYMIGEQRTNNTKEHRIDHTHVLAKVPVASLLKLSVEGMEVYEGGAAAPAKKWIPYTEAMGENQKEAADRIRKHMQPIFPSADAKSLSSERIGMGYLKGPGLWYIADMAGNQTKNGEEEESKRLVLKTASQPEGPWKDHIITTMPREYSSSQYSCPSLYLLSGLVANKDWQAAFGLACNVRGHRARVVKEGRRQLSVQSGPTEVEFIRFEFMPLTEVAVGAGPARR